MQHQEREEVDEALLPGNLCLSGQSKAGLNLLRREIRPLQARRPDHEREQADLLAVGERVLLREIRPLQAAWLISLEECRVRQSLGHVRANS